MIVLLRRMTLLRQDRVCAPEINERICDQRCQPQERVGRDARILTQTHVGGRRLGHPGRNREPLLLELEGEHRIRFDLAADSGAKAAT
jgi:hypothetical protein